MQKTLTFNIDELKEKELQGYLESIGNSSQSSNLYVKWCFKGEGWTALMYSSKKLVVQSNSEQFLKDIQGKLNPNEKFEPHIGSDEVGKGDYFGPLVVCACYIDDLEKINHLGLTDSKKITDENILKLGKQLVEKLDYEIEIVEPRKYAQLHNEFQNVSIVLSKLHIKAIEKLFKRVGGAKFVVIDQFSKNQNRLKNEFKLPIPLKQYHHAESDIAVAAASILARYFFLLEFEKMNKEYGLKFPLGATHVIPFGKNFVKEFGEEKLGDVAKISFRTTKQIINSSLF